MILLPLIPMIGVVSFEEGMQGCLEDNADRDISNALEDCFQAHAMVHKSVGLPERLCKTRFEYLHFYAEHPTYTFNCTVVDSFLKDGDNRRVCETDESECHARVKALLSQN